MNESEKNATDELQLQRLVDGELSDLQRHQLLTSLDRRPELWRDVALAYVEEQVWRDVIENGSRRQVSINRHLPSPAHAAKRSWSWRAVLVVAASLFAVLAVGFQLGQRRSGLSVTRDSPTKEVRQPRDLIAMPNPPEPSINDATPPVYRLQLVYGDGPSRQLVELPVYDASQVPSNEWTPDVRAAEELNRGLSSLGYRFDWQTDYLSGDLTDGRQLVVPVRSAALEYYGQ